NIFKVPVSKVRVIVPYLGGGYGGKVYPKVEPITVALAQKAGRPVRVVLAREEGFYTINKHAAVIRNKNGGQKNGNLNGTGEQKRRQLDGAGVRNASRHRGLRRDRSAGGKEVRLYRCRSVQDSQSEN